MKRWSVLVSFVAFIAVCMSATFWAMQLFKTKERAVAAPPPIARQEYRLDAAAGLFGGRPAAVAVASNFQLKGVVVSTPPEDSVAILSTDGKPPQAIAVNAEVIPGVIVKEVHAKYVLLLEGSVTKRVELPDTGQPLQVDMVSNAPVPNQAVQPAPQSMGMMPMATPSSTLPSAPPTGTPNGVFRMEPPRQPGGG